MSRLKTPLLGRVAKLRCRPPWVGGEEEVEVEMEVPSKIKGEVVEGGPGLNSNENVMVRRTWRLMAGNEYVATEWDCHS